MPHPHESSAIKMTPLRSDVLSIILSAKKPLSAYEILDKLRKKRPGAEPPTVYRVLDFLTQQNAIHKVESTSKFIACSQAEHCETNHRGILFSCQNCFGAMEFADKHLSQAVLAFCKQNTLIFSNSLLEIKGVCAKCNK